MIPWHGTPRTFRPGTQPPSGKVERVRLVEYSREMARLHLQHMVGIVEGHIGDEVLVRFGEIVVQVPAEWLEPVGA